MSPAIAELLAEMITAATKLAEMQERIFVIVFICLFLFIDRLWN